MVPDIIPAHSSLQISGNLNDVGTETLDEDRRIVIFFSEEPDECEVIKNPNTTIWRS